MIKNMNDHEKCWSLFRDISIENNENRLKERKKYQNTGEKRSSSNDYYIE